MSFDRFPVEQSEQHMIVDYRDFTCQASVTCWIKKKTKL